SYHIAPSHIRWLDPERAGNEIHDPFGCKRRLWSPGPAIGCIWHLVGGDDFGFGEEVLDPVGPGEVRNRVIHHTTADRIECTDVGQESVLERENSSIVVEAHHYVMDLISRMARAHQMLVAVLNPFDRPADLARQEGDQQIFRIDVTLDAETAADIGRYAAHASLRHTECRRHFAADPMHHLSRRPDCQRLRPRIVLADHPAAFDWQGRIEMMIEPA